MKVPAPVKTSVEGFQISVEEIEAILQHPPMKLPPWKDAYMNLKDGRQSVHPRHAGRRRPHPVGISWKRS